MKSRLVVMRSENIVEGDLADLRLQWGGNLMDSMNQIKHFLARIGKGVQT